MQGFCYNRGHVFYRKVFFITFIASYCVHVLMYIPPLVLCNLYANMEMENCWLLLLIARSRLIGTWKTQTFSTWKLVERWAPSFSLGRYHNQQIGSSTPKKVLIFRVVLKAPHDCLLPRRLKLLSAPRWKPFGLFSYSSALPPCGALQLWFPYVNHWLNYNCNC